MSNQITIKDLEGCLGRLNRIKGFENAKYGTVGIYCLDYAYGGCQLQQYVNEGGGIKVISAGGYVSKRELYNQMQAIFNIID